MQKEVEPETDFFRIFFVEKEIMKKYQHLTQRQRFIIQHLRDLGKNNTEIAHEARVHRSTVSREIIRNKNSAGGYKALGAQAVAMGRRIDPFDRRRKISGVLEEIIREKLNLRWSPEQISGRLKLEGKWSISHEAIYRWIYSMAPGFKNALRRRRGINSRRGRRKLRKIAGAPRKLITLRPQGAIDRSEIGHYERDLMEGKRSGPSLLVITDRCSRLVKLTKVLSHESDEISEATRKTLKNLTVKTLTNDNGFEFSHHEKLERKLLTNIYFTHPYSSWERGTVENTNGLIRQFCPKGVDLTPLKKADLALLEKNLNTRPRKVLNYRTSEEIHFEKSVRLVKSKKAYKRQIYQRIISKEIEFWRNLKAGRL
jgi:IS30 family transposase